VEFLSHVAPYLISALLLLVGLLYTTNRVWSLDHEELKGSRRENCDLRREKHEIHEQMSVAKADNAVLALKNRFHRR
jgi:hypothetical protein